MPMNFKAVDNRFHGKGMKLEAGNWTGGDPEGRSHQFPENMIGKGYYRDSGCELAPSCIRCPLPQCKYDLPHGPEVLKKRNREIYRLVADEGRRAEDVAVEYNISKRTVHRAVQKVRVER